MRTGKVLRHAGGRWVRALAGLGVLAGTLFLPARAPARLVFDPADPAFTGAVLETFDGLGLVTGQTSFTATYPAATLAFASPAAASIVTCSAGACVLPAPFPAGIQVSVAGAVSAIGFQHRWLECPGHITFTGSAGTETFQAPFSTRTLFIGAADIGDITAITLASSCPVPELWDDMRLAASSVPPPATVADLGLVKGVSGVSATAVTYSLTVDNAGPHGATGVQVVDFLPPFHPFLSASQPATLDPTGTVATVTLGDVPAGAGDVAHLELAIPPFGQGLYCESVTLNAALVTAPSLEVDAADNLATRVLHFNKASRAGFPEVCDNGIDDDCDGRIDCDDPECGCAPQLPVSGGGVVCSGGEFAPVPTPTGVLLTDGCVTVNVVDRTATPSPTAPQPQCNVPVVGTACAVSTATLAPRCCQAPPPGTTPDAVDAIIAGCVAALPAGCSVAVGFPIDPNFKASDPPVNILGYGYTEAGRTHTYTLHYENVGTADAHDVSVVDVLPPDLDPATLVVNDGGVFDPVAGTIVWRDPVVPPATPRSVSFSAAVRADAPAATRIRNVGTVIFPDAVPPTRIDTNAVEHAVVSPGAPVVPLLAVVGCTPTAPGASTWRVALANTGFGFAYNVTATILDAPASVQVLQPTARFAHPDDPDPSTVATVIAAAITRSSDTVEFATGMAGDPCATFTWRLQYQDLAGQEFTRDIPPAAGPDIEDLCPCAGPAPGETWKNHGQYVSCVVYAAKQLAASGQITAQEKGAIVSQAARSQCGRRAR